LKSLHQLESNEISPVKKIENENVLPMPNKIKRLQNANIEHQMIVMMQNNQKEGQQTVVETTIDRQKNTMDNFKPPAPFDAMSESSVQYVEERN